jgi:hypothetical protein
MAHRYDPECYCFDCCDSEERSNSRTPVEHDCDEEERVRPDVGRELQLQLILV